jgi:hypothetical protein
MAGARINQLAIAGVDGYKNPHHLISHTQQDANTQDYSFLVLKLRSASFKERLKSGNMVGQFLSLTSGWFGVEMNLGVPSLYCL